MTLARSSALGCTFLVGRSMLACSFAPRLGSRSSLPRCGLVLFRSRTGFTAMRLARLTMGVSCRHLFLALGKRFGTFCITPLVRQCHMLASSI
jgi:hypothetical protein